MSIGPILPGRLPAEMLANRLQSSLQESNRTLAQLQDQAATGQRFFNMSENPGAAVRTMFYQKALERQEHFQVSVATDRSLLELTETSLSSVGEALSHAKGLLLSGIGDSATPAEKEALAVEVQSIIEQVINIGNSQFRGRYLFAGSESKTTPFERLSNGEIRYNGDEHSTQSYIDFSHTVANNVDGNSAFNAFSTPISRDINPAVTLNTKISTLLQGDGIGLGEIQITVDDTVNPVQTEVVDLTGSETIEDIKIRVEAAFAGGPPTLTVGINATNDGLLVTPSGGTVEIVDLEGARVADHLGIASPAAATISGDDLDPLLTLNTLLSDLNGGAAATFTDGIQITTGDITRTVDISTAATVQDLFNLIELEELDLEININSSRNGIAISSRVSGRDFAIGENGGDDATDLGIRTFSAQTLLDDLNGGAGVPVNSAETLDITRRDGTVVNVDLSGTLTIDDVLTAINVIDPGVLVASLNSVGNGITILDNDGVSTGPLIISENNISRGLGVNGSETGVNPAVPLTGTDVNRQEAQGIFNLLFRLESALRSEDDLELNRLDNLLSDEIDRFSVLRGEIGSRLKLLDDVEQRLLDQEVSIRESLSVEFDADIAEVITQVAYLQASIQATLQIASSTFQLTLTNFL